MPGVTIRYDVQSFVNFANRRVLYELSGYLPRIIAEHLSTGADSPGALVPDDIMLNFNEYGLGDVRGKCILLITVEANLYRQRSRDIDRRTKEIKDAIAALPCFSTLHLKDDQWHVWVRLSKGSFR